MGLIDRAKAAGLDAGDRLTGAVQAAEHRAEDWIGADRYRKLLKACRRDRREYYGGGAGCAGGYLGRV
jgi:hypothetical protein